MLTLPSPTVLAGLVSNVTETMLGISFRPAQRGPGTAPAQPGQPEGDPTRLLWRTALLPIPGAEPVTVGLSSDQKGCTALTAAMFDCPPEAVDAAMAEDALRELVNMTAGLIKSTLGLNQALGLPRIFSDPSVTSPGGRVWPDAMLVLEARDLGIVLWVTPGILDHV